MSDGQKKYDKFIEKVKKAYPELKLEEQYKKGQQLWNECKNKEEELTKVNLTLDEKIANARSKNDRIWLGLFSQPKKKKKKTSKDPVETVVTIEDGVEIVEEGAEESK